MKSEFDKGGYYAVTIPDQPNLRLIVLNTTLFSTIGAGKGIRQAANEQLNWLHKELEFARVKHQRVFIAMHIPPVVDVYALLRIRLFTLVQLWKPRYIQRFQAELKQFAPQIAGMFSGHLHSDWYQILTFDNSNEFPFTGTTSISPIFNNNPGFKVYSYSANLELDNFITYYYSLRDKQSWMSNSSFIYLLDVPLNYGILPRN